MRDCGRDAALIGVDEALTRVIAAATPLGIEPVTLAAARGRVLAADVQTRAALPAFTQSAVDGYTLRYADLQALPCTLPLGEPITARMHAEQPRLAPGGAARILTGGLLPLGADTVARQEGTVANESSVTILQPVRPGADIRHQGEELAAGATISAAGQLVTPGLIGALSLAGLGQLTVWRQPRIVVLVTGDELVAAGGVLRLGQVPDANGPMLQAFLSAWGMPPLRLETVPDRAAAVREALLRARAEADVVITTGGVSVGDHDYVPAVAEALGSQRIFWKVAQKPGMPLYVARLGDALLFGLPGNPASVLVNLLVYVRAALDTLQGLAADRRWYVGRCSSPLTPDRSMTRWLRASMQHDDDHRRSLLALPNQGSHMLGNLAEANALMRVDPGPARDDAIRTFCAIE